MKDEVVYRSKVQIELIKSAYRRAYLPTRTEPVYFSVHSEIAEYYGVDNEVIPQHPTTLDYVVASAAG